MRNTKPGTTLRLPCRYRCLAASVLAFSLLGAMAGIARAQDPEDELGNWLIFNSTLRFSSRWSLFTEAQIRLWEVASNLNETLLRATVHYDLSPQAMVGFGYVRSDVWPFDDPNDGGREVTENRLYQQFAIRQTWGRAGFEHRYRLEQRWIDRGNGTDRSDRMRYRLQVTTPLNRDSMQAGAYFINVYDEIFFNLGGERAFDQNRFYIAGGHQFTSDSNLQFGILWQARSSADFFRLQIFYTHNFNLEERGGDDP